MRAAVALLILFVAGCAAPPTAPAQPDAPEVPTWSTPAILDPVRSGGEPVIFVTPQGSLFVAAHPGYTHVKPPPGPELLTPSSAQSYLFRSTDDGATWAIVEGAARMRNPQAPGFTDPDLAVNEDGSRLVLVDLEALAGLSTSASNDDGVTWPAANAYATNPADGSVDRPWLSYLDGTFYLLYNGDGDGHWRLRTSPDGIAWSDHSTPGDGSFPGALIADPKDRALYVGNGDKVWSSLDGGNTFEASNLPTKKALTGIVAQRPAVDAAGVVYFSWSEMDAIWYAASHDHARTWGAPVRLSTPGTHIWPWPVAGADGRLAVVWVGTTDITDDPGSARSEWRVHAAFIDAAGTDRPAVVAGAIENAVVTRGAICLNGTFCEVEGKDRRLGDFITAAIGATGDLHIAYGTTETGHSISSPGYVRQTGGFRLTE